MVADDRSIWLDSGKSMRGEREASMQTVRMLTEFVDSQNVGAVFHQIPPSTCVTHSEAKYERARDQSLTVSALSSETADWMSCCVWGKFI